MTELTDISAAANRSIVERQYHHATRPGAGQVAAFHADVDAVVARYATAFDNLAARTGVSVTSAKAALVALGDDAKSAATSAGKVEPPAAA